MTESDVKNLDQSNMLKILKDFPEQIILANQIGEEAPFLSKEVSSNNFILMGMGGSAIGGDLLRSYLNGIGGNKINMSISRGYNLPKYADDTYNFIASSYSGGTEETISSIKEAIELQGNIICITSGGEIENICKNSSLPVINIPGGMMPRCALGLSFFSLLQLFLKTNLISDEVKSVIKSSIDNTIELLKKKSLIYSNIDNEKNYALSIAKMIKNNIAIIYSGNELMDVVNLRWRGQIQENSKALAFGNVFPEMNHNEINSWIYPDDLLKRFVAIYLSDKDYHPKVKARIKAVDNILSEKMDGTVKIESMAPNLLSRMFDILYLGDWVSFYLALLNDEDPTPIPLIMRLKDELSKI